MCSKWLHIAVVASLILALDGRRTVEGRRADGHDHLGSTVETHHPGHRAVHVTRLHRNEHSGLAAMLESEEKWQGLTSKRTLETERSKITLRQNTGKQFMKLSPAQASALQLHHSLESQRTKALADDWEAQVAREAELAKKEKQDEGLEIMRQGGDMLAYLRNIGDHSGKPVAGGHAVTGLHNLHSQYVGPIGVGTMLSPEGCCSKKTEDAAAPAQAPSGAHDESLLLEKHQVACTVSAQQQVWVVFDTGSTNIWVASDLCKEGPCVMKGRHRYNHTLSATFDNPKDSAQLTVQFGTGKLVGPHAIDNFEIGPFTVHNQQFAMIQEQEGQVFKDVPFEGILGLAFPAMAARGSKPFFDTIVEQKALDKNEFAFYFSKDNPSANAIFWGGVDPAFHEEPIKYFPVVDPYYWSLTLHSFRIGDTEYLGDGTWKKGSKSEKKTEGSKLLQVESGEDAKPTQVPRAIVDTGTTYFTAEEEVYDKVMKALDVGQCLNMNDETHPPMTFTLGSADGPHDIVLTHDQYMAVTGGTTWCEPAFMKIDIPKAHGPGMILGEAFLRQYMGVFDRQDGDIAKARVGFAKAASGDDTHKRLKELTSSQPSFGYHD